MADGKYSNIKLSYTPIPPVQPQPMAPVGYTPPQTWEGLKYRPIPITDETGQKTEALWDTETNTVWRGKEQLGSVNPQTGQFTEKPLTGWEKAGETGKEIGLGAIKGLSYLFKPFEYAQEYVINPVVELATMPWWSKLAPQVTPGELTWEDIKALFPEGEYAEAYHEWQAPKFLKGTLEILPWFLLPSFGSMAGGLSKLGKVGQVASKALIPYVATEKLMGKIISVPIKQAGKVIKNITMIKDMELAAPKAVDDLLADVKQLHPNILKPSKGLAITDKQIEKFKIEKSWQEANLAADAIKANDNLLANNETQRLASTVNKFGTAEQIFQLKKMPVEGHPNLSMQSKVTANWIKPKNEGDSMYLRDILEHPDRYVMNNSVEGQVGKKWIEQYHDAVKSVDRLRANNVSKELSGFVDNAPAGGERSPSRVIAQYDLKTGRELWRDDPFAGGSRGGTIAAMKTRKFSGPNAQKKGIELGYEYADDPVQPLTLYAKGTYNMASYERQMGILKIPYETPTQRMERMSGDVAERMKQIDESIKYLGGGVLKVTKPNKLTGETQVILRKNPGVNRLIASVKRGEVPAASTVAAIERRFPELGRNLRNALDITYLEVDEAVKGIADAIMKDTGITKEQFLKAVEDIRAKAAKPTTAPTAGVTPPEVIKPITTPEVIKPSQSEINQWISKGYTKEDIESLSAMTPELRELTTHQARMTGFRNVSNEAVDDYLQKVLKLAKSKNNLKAIEDIELAIQANDSGLLQNAVMESESALNALHMDEIGELREIQRVAFIAENFPKAEVGMPEAGLQPSMIPEVAAKEVRPAGKGKVTQISMEEQLKLDQVRKAALPQSPRIAEIKSLLETKGRVPAGQGTKPELKLELARLEAQQAVAGNTPDGLARLIEQTQTELGNRSMPYHGGATNMFPEYDVKQLDEYLKVLESAQAKTAVPPITPSPATKVTGKITNNELGLALDSLGVSTRKEIKFLRQLYADTYKLNKVERSQALDDVMQDVKNQIASLRVEKSKGMPTYRKAKEASITAAAAEGRILNLPGWMSVIIPAKTEWGITGRQIADEVMKRFTPEKVNPIISKASTVARMGVTLTAALDASLIFIQGPLALGHDIQKWSKLQKSSAFLDLVKGMVKGVWNPKFQDELIAKESAILGKYAPEGLVVSKAVDYLQPDMITNALNKFGKLGQFFGKVFNQTYGRAGEGFGAGSLAARINIIKYGEKSFLADGWTPRQIAEYANKITGVIDPGVLGVSATRRALESATLFSPNYTRAYLMVMRDVLRGGMTASEVRKSLAGMLGAGLLGYVGLCEAIGQEPKLNPAPKALGGDGAEFMSFKIGNSVIGLPGFWYSAIRMMVGVAAAAEQEPEKLLSLNWRDNDFLKFWMGRTSPLVSIGREIIEQKDYMGRNLDSPGDWVETMGTHFLTIAGQNLITHNPGEEEGKFKRFTAEIFGLRTYPTSEWTKVQDLRDTYTTQKFDTAWDKLNQEQKDTIRKEHPDYAAKETEAREQMTWETGEDYEIAIQSAGKQADAVYHASVEDAANGLLNGLIDYKTYLNQDEYLRRIHRGSRWMENYLQSFLDPDRVKDIAKWRDENERLEDTALSDYWNIRNNPVTVGGVPDWDATEVKTKDYLGSLDSYTRSYVLRNKDRWVESLPPTAKKLAELQTRGRDIVDEYYDQPEKQRVKYRRANPTVDAWLLLMGRVTVPQTQMAMLTAIKELNQRGLPLTIVPRLEGAIQPARMAAPATSKYSNIRRI